MTMRLLPQVQGMCNPSRNGLGVGRKLDCCIGQAGRSALRRSAAKVGIGFSSDRDHNDASGGADIAPVNKPGKSGKRLRGRRQALTSSPSRHCYSRNKIRPTDLLNDPVKGTQQLRCSLAAHWFFDFN